jgi:hypothetical protein
MERKGSSSSMFRTTFVEVYFKSKIVTYGKYKYRLVIAVREAIKFLCQGNG